MSRSIRKETSSLVFGIVGRFGGSSTGFVVAALNAASAASREVVVLRVLSAGILCPRARLHFLKRKLGGHTKGQIPKHNRAIVVRVSVVADSLCSSLLCGRLQVDGLCRRGGGVGCDGGSEFFEEIVGGLLRRAVDEALAEL